MLFWGVFVLFFFVYSSAPTSTQNVHAGKRQKFYARTTTIPVSNQRGRAGESTGEKRREVFHLVVVYECACVCLCDTHV